MPAFFYTYSVGERSRSTEVKERKRQFPSAIAQGADRVASREIKQTATIFTECFF
jgi:hypothetical protein